MPEDDAIAARIEQLEIRITYQDETIEALNQTIMEQWQQIDRLKRQLTQLDARLQEAESRSGAAPQSEPPPPHY